MGWTARSLALHQGFSSPYFPQTGPTALVPPLYPWLLSVFFRVFGIYTNTSAFIALAVNSLFSSLTAAVIFFGVRGRLGDNTAAGCAWLWALYPYSIYYSAVYLWDFALTTLLFALCFFLASTRLAHMGRIGWGSFGGLAGLAGLSNPSVLPLILLLILYGSWQRWCHRGKAAQHLLLASVSMVAVLSPWVIRNQEVFHQHPILRDGFWGEFYAGNNGDSSHSNPEWVHPASSPREMLRYQELGETRYMAEKKRLSVQHVRTHPAQFVVLSMRRLVRFWTGYWSFSRSYLSDQELDIPNVPFCTILTLLMLLGLHTAWRRSPMETLPYVAAFVLFPLPYYVTHASVDYRQPIEPLVVVMVACTAKCLWKRSAITSSRPVACLGELRSTLRTRDTFKG